MLGDRRQWPNAYAELKSLIEKHPSTAYKVDALREMIRFSAFAKRPDQTVLAAKQILREFPDHVHVDVALHQLHGLLPAAEYWELLGTLVKEHHDTRAAAKAAAELSKME